ncbi:MAG TPA: efflux transporter outer membrane subunit [Sphingomicrobium sp.]|jgi:NodT family efflux transporter outer membrane factor (OMF) lipoprotein|nr:efflux transporter outer membrane subunit [Sphingomicrobium sp.]
MKRCLLIAPLLVAGCNLAPPYHRPATVPIPPSFKEAPGWIVGTPNDTAARGEWWRLFDDPVLDSLEAKVVVTNQNVAEARAAYEAARALVIVQRSALFPTVTGSVNASHSGHIFPTTSNSNSSGTGGSTTGSGATGTGATGSNFALDIGATWEPDLWGKLGNAVTQARANAQASAGDLENATLSARGELATDYVELRGIDGQRVLLDATITDYQKSLTITINKYNAGTVAHSDVFQAQTSLENAIASRQDLDRQRAILEHAIAMLAGENPSTFSIAATIWNPVVPSIPGVVPATLLERRPDIAAAERRVAAANANIGIQRAAYFPQVTLSGDAGTSGSRLGQLFSAATSVWSLGLSGLMTLLDFGARRGQVLQARAQYEEAVATYRETVLTAFQQVEDNLAATRILAGVTASQAAAATAATRAEAITTNQYAGGIVDYTEVVVARNAALSARQTQIQAVVNQQTAVIALIQAIGGNWG